MHCPSRAMLHNIAVCHNGKLLNRRLARFAGLLTQEKLAEQQPVGHSSHLWFFYDFLS